MVPRLLGTYLVAQTALLIRLECQLPADLPPARKLLADGLAEGTVSHVVVQIEIRMIEEVEELEADLKFEPLRNIRVLIDAEVGLGESRLPELLWFLAAFGSERGYGELP